MIDTQKVIEFLTKTTSNEFMNEKQYRLYDRATDGLHSYKDEYGEIDRGEYFENEVNAWDENEVEEFVNTFNL